MMISVFIAGPYGDDNDLETKQVNVNDAMIAWHALDDLGFAAYCPHLSHYLDQFCHRDRQQWLAHSLHWLGKCDCILYLGDSPGARIERNRAWCDGKPVFNSVEELTKAYGMGE